LPASFSNVAAYTATAGCHIRVLPSYDGYSTFPKTIVRDFRS
jgi:hypothetical protein